ncbi:MAG: NAD(P)-dependent oxidoreductase [Myxococcota bacterium]
MSKTPPLPETRGEAVFEDYKPAWTDAQALAEANRCLYCIDAPCVSACPTEINIPEFIRKIATGNVKGSARTIFDSNILGMSCARVCPVEVLCVGDCVYNRLGQQPIQIGKLQRYSTDRALQQGWKYYAAGPDSGKRVALIGAGPASLSCAHRLRRFGHAVTIFEKKDGVRGLGGLNTNGVAPYKMKADRSLEEVDWVLSIGGIEVKTGVEIGKDLSLSDLEAQFDAVFVGIGLGPDHHLGVPGEDLAGVEGAVQFIEKMKLDPITVGARRAVVVGGGNTAMDCVRELASMGVPEVTLVYRGTEPAMSGYSHEWDAAKILGVRAAWQTQPIAYLGEGGKVTGVQAVKLDAQKKPIAGSEHVIGADLVLVAIGQAKLLAQLAALDGIRMDKSRVVIDRDGATGRAKWFAGGDLANGGKEVVNAVAEGRDAAAGIHAYLMGAS